jgi:hypothetical protein
MSSQIGGATNVQVNELFAEGSAYFNAENLKETAKTAKHIVSDISGHSDNRVNLLATQLNKDAEKLLEILGGPAAPSSSGLFSGFFGSKTATPPSASTTTTPAPPTTSTQKVQGPITITTPSSPSSTTPASKKTPTRSWRNFIKNTTTTRKNKIRAMTAVPENVEPKSTFSMNNPLRKTRKAQPTSTPTIAVPQSSAKVSRLGEKQTGKRNLSTNIGIELPTLKPSGPPPSSSRPRSPQEPTPTRPESSFIIPTVNNAPPLNIPVTRRAALLEPKLFPTSTSVPEDRMSPAEIRKRQREEIAANREKRKESFEQKPSTTYSLQQAGPNQSRSYQQPKPGQYGGQRNTRKYSKKHAHRQTRRG